MRISKRTAILSLCSAAVILLVCLQLLTGLQDGRGGVPPAESLEGGSSNEPDISAPADTAQGQGSARVETLVQNEPTPIQYRFIDATFGHSIQAEIIPSTGPWAVASTEGVAEVLLGEVIGPIHAHYGGYQPVLLSAADQGGDTPMTATRHCGVRVVDAQGAPLASVPVSWSILDTATESASIERLTGADGIASISAAADCHAIVSGAPGTLPRKVRVPVGATVDVVLRGAGPSLLLVDSETGAPLPRVELLLSRSARRNDIARRVTSDGEGKILLDDGGGLLSVSLEDPRHILALELGEGWERKHLRHAFFLNDLGTNLGPEVSIRLPLAKEAIAITLLDRATREAIDGPIRHGLIRDYRGAQARPHSLRESTVRAGVLQLMAFDVEKLLGYRAKLFLWPDGYHPVSTFDLQAVRDSSDGTVTFLFDASEQRSLRIVNREGVIVRTPFVIESTDKKRIYYRGPGKKDGTYGPFDWLGDELLVLRESGGAGFAGGTAKEVGRVQLSELLQDEVATLVINQLTTTVEVHGVAGRTAGIVLLDLGGQLHQASTRDEQNIIFSNIPVGPIFLGPPVWAKQLWMRYNNHVIKPLMRARRDAVNHFDWDERWAASEDITGWVRYPAPGPFPLHLIPAYGTAKANVPQAPLTPWIPLGSDGRYTIPRGDPIPDALVVCSLLTDAGIAGFCFPIVVHDAVVPGADVDLAMGELELHWDAGEWLGRVGIDWAIPPVDYHHPDGKALAKISGREGSAFWPSGERYILRGLPAGDLAIRFLPPKLGWTQTIHVVAGERTVVKLLGRPKRD